MNVTIAMSDSRCLAARASDDVVLKVVEDAPEILRREAPYYWRVRNSSLIRLLARVHKLHKLPDDIRIETADELERASLQSLDISFVTDDAILALFQSSKLVLFGVQLVRMLEATVPDRIENIECDADPDRDIPDQFDEVTSFLEKMEEVFSEEDCVRTTLDTVKDAITDAIARVSLREKPDEDLDGWPDVAPAKVAPAPKGRSIFSDIDE